jgi:hypothetical protein
VNVYEIADALPDIPMLTIVCSPGPKAYCAFAVDYYERALPANAVARAMAGEPLDDDISTSINESASVATIEDDARQIGYPIRR